MENQQKQPKKLPKLTKQEDKFTDKVIETGNLTQAVKESFGIEDPNYAGVKGHRLLRKDKIMNAIEVKRESLKTALESQGVTPTKIAEKINTLLDATTGDKPDINAIDKGLKHATNIYGVEEEQDKPKENVYNFFFEPKFQQNIKNYDQNLKEQILNKDVEENQNSI